MQFTPSIRVTQEVDDRGAWVTAPGSDAAMQVSAEDAIPLRLQALFYGPLQLRTAFPDVTVAGLELFDGRPAVRLALTRDETGPALLVEIDSWLPRGLRYHASSPLGIVAATAFYRSYRTVDGVAIADRIVIEAAGQQTELQLERIERR
jgi:hypothetical protein